MKNCNKLNLLYTLNKTAFYDLSDNKNGSNYDST